MVCFKELQLSLGILSSALPQGEMGLAIWYGHQVKAHACRHILQAQYVIICEVVFCQVFLKLNALYTVGKHFEYIKVTKVKHLPFFKNHIVSALQRKNSIKKPLLFKASSLSPKTQTNSFTVKGLNKTAVFH